MSLISLLLSKSTYGCTSTIHKALINVTSKLVSIKGKCCVLNHSFLRQQSSAVPWRLCCPFGKLEFLLFPFPVVQKHWLFVRYVVMCNGAGENPGDQAAQAWGWRCSGSWASMQVDVCRPDPWVPWVNLPLASSHSCSGPVGLPMEERCVAHMERPSTWSSFRDNEPLKRYWKNLP